LQHPASITNPVLSLHDALPIYHLVEKALHKDIARIDRIAKQIDADLFTKATRKLHEAEHIYVIGAGASKIAAQWFHKQVCINLLDRKSTRLNSSHVSISYAVLC